MFKIMKKLTILLVLIASFITAKATLSVSPSSRTITSGEN